MVPPWTLTIVTGASRGIGHAMALQLLAQPGHHVVTIARHTCADLEKAAGEGASQLSQWQADLANAEPVADKLSHWLQGLAGQTWREVRLVNNAALMPSPIAPLAATPSKELVQVLRVGLEAPMLMTASFLRATQDWHVPRKVLNISSGLARIALASQSPYSAAKAGVDHFTRCLAQEESLKPQGAKVCALAPGVVDTQMQAQMRNTQASDFPAADSFQQLHVSARLRTAQATAALALAHLDSAHFGRQVIAEIPML